MRSQKLVRPSNGASTQCSRVATPRLRSCNSWRRSSSGVVAAAVQPEHALVVAAHEAFGPTGEVGAPGWIASAVWRVRTDRSAGSRGLPRSSNTTSFTSGMTR
ncbi:MAG: hypothetical protein IPK74_32190 [Deltaproteobacteria bacterium]|nr:hypothetical protein [Deltaproteobacteria bacterium]